MAGLLARAYWQGVLRATKDWDEVLALKTGLAPSIGAVDLANGRERAGEEVDRMRHSERCWPNLVNWCWCGGRGGI